VTRLVYLQRAHISSKEELSVIKTMVSIEVDLASSLAVRFACQLGGVMDMEILPVYVKESPPPGSAMGAGWASRTWEKEMVQQGKAEIAELISAEMDFCPVLAEPRVIYGDRETELYKITQVDRFDLFVEGIHSPWTTGDIYKRLHTRLYQTLPSPAVLVRSLRKIDQVQLLCLDVDGTRSLTKAFQRIWKNCSVPLVLKYSEIDGDKAGTSALAEAIDEARSLLVESGCTVSVQDGLSLSPGEDTSATLDACGLVAVAVHRSPRKDSPEIHWIGRVKTASLLVFH